MKLLKGLLTGSILLLLFVFNNVEAIAGNPDDGQVIKITASKTGKKIGVVLKKKNQRPTTLRIIDAKDELLFEEITSNKSNFRKTFDLGSLPVGNYFLSIDNGHKELVQPIYILKDMVYVYKKERVVFFYPVFKQTDDRLDFALLNTDDKSDVVFSVIDENGESVFREKLHNPLKVERRYNLSNLEGGDYVVRVDTRQKTYYKNIVLK